jgi:ABC-type bacteriocin/lantibiotic exporter with double-glycine peptidase domain
MAAPAPRRLGPSPTEDRGRHMVERTPLSPKDVVITRTMAKFGNTSYQIAAISSVSVQHQESVNRTFLSTGLLLIIAVLVIGYFEWASWLQVGIAGGIIVVITALLSSAFPIRTATLVLTTASGEAQALTSRDIAGVEEVKLLIEDAFTARA